MRRAVVVGAGISGLAFAHALQSLRPDDEITVLEAAQRVGGKITTLQRDGFTVEGGPNGFLDSNPALRDLARAVGLEGQLVPASEEAGRNRFLLHDGQLCMLPSGILSFLTSGLLGWMGKLDVLMELFRRRRLSTREEAIDSFIRRRGGRELAHTLGDAFVTGILAGDPKLLSMQACFPRIAAYERDHGSVTVGMLQAARNRPGGTTARQQMWSLPGGLQALVDAISRSLRVAPRTSSPVRRVLRAGAGWRVETDGHTWEADVVALACPAKEQARALQGVDAELAGRVGGIPYNRVVTVALGYRRADVPHPLDGFGYLSPQRQRRDVLGMQWCSSIFPGRAPDGHVLVRALCGGWHRGDVVDWDDARLVAAVRKEMRRVTGARAAPTFCEIVRWEEAIPQYFVGHLANVAWVEERCRLHPGLFLGGNAYRGVALPDCAQHGRALAEQAAAYLAGLPA
jgi:oxygen-dependent protoporphyrinogen oxidase